MTETLWTAGELAQATGGRFEGEFPQAFGGVSIDSRQISPGDIFFAIQGDRLDGHDFAANALRAGAGLAVVSRVDDAMRAAGPLLVVPDTLEALRDLARAARARSTAKIIGVTGSVGKTGTKEALRQALSVSGSTHASASSFNNHWGVPLSLARLPRTARFAVFEIGMNHAGEITPLTRLVQPHVVVITTIAPSHIGNFASLQGIADAKAEILLGLDPASGAVILNRDNEFFGYLAGKAGALGISRITSFGVAEGTDARLVRSVLKEECSCVTADIFGHEVIYKLGSPGAHVAANSLAVLSAVHLAGADLARAAVALADLRPPKGRGERFTLSIDGEPFTLIDESYNANPESVRAAIALLGQTQPPKGGRRIAVLGDMLELGEQGPAMHGRLAPALDEAGCDGLYACGPLMRNLWDEASARIRVRYAASSEELRDHVIADVRAGDVVMVKGSLGSRMGLIVEALRKKFA